MSIGAILPCEAQYPLRIFGLCGTSLDEGVMSCDKHIIEHAWISVSA